MGIHIVTANNTALSGSKIVRDAIKKAERSRKVHYLREVAVGGGLPIVSTLRDLLSSGDHIRRIDGILSVSMSYIMHRTAPPPGVYECSAYDDRAHWVLIEMINPCLRLQTRGRRVPLLRLSKKRLGLV